MNDNGGYRKFKIDENKVYLYQYDKRHEIEMAIVLRDDIGFCLFDGPTMSASKKLDIRTPSND